MLKPGSQHLAPAFRPGEDRKNERTDMKTLQAIWQKCRERHYSSIQVRFRIPTLLGGLILGGPALGAGLSLGLMTSPEYWSGLGLPIVMIGLGAGSILWGWFCDPVAERPKRPKRPRQK